MKKSSFRFLVVVIPMFGLACLLIVGRVSITRDGISGLWQYRPVPMLMNDWSIKSQFIGIPPGEFTSSLSCDELIRTPAWPPWSAYPPLSPGKAERLAFATLAKVMGKQNWTAPDISLQAFDVTRGAGDHRDIRWIYVLHFTLLGVTDFEGGHANIIVLMNGTVVQPKIDDGKTINSETDKELTERISEALALCQTIKPGMTRAQLLKMFTTEGGISTAIHQTYVYIRCPYIKVDVDFKLSEPKQGVLEEKPTDTVTRISRPYLDWSIKD
jgi:hypothetical protein